MFASAVLVILCVAGAPSLFSSGARKPGRLVVQQVFTPAKCARGRGALRSRRGDTLSVGYVGKLADGAVFDSTLARGGNPFSFELGAHLVVEGWEEALTCMCVGEKRRLVIPPQLAYGARGAPPSVPGGATLTYVVELFGLKAGKRHLDYVGQMQNLWQHGSGGGGGGGGAAAADRASEDCVVPGSALWRRCRTHSVVGAWSVCAGLRAAQRARELPSAQGPVPTCGTAGGARRQQLGMRYRRRQHVRCDAGTGFKGVMLQFVQRSACCVREEDRFRAGVMLPAVPRIKPNAVWLPPALDTLGAPAEGVPVKALEEGLQVNIYSRPPQCDVADGSMASAQLPVGWSWPRARPGARLLVDYTGWLYDPSRPAWRGARVDADQQRGANSTALNFTLGRGAVLPAWDTGLRGMCAGEERYLTVPPVLAYGAGGAGELVPPNQWLLFRVRLVSANGRGGWVKPSAAAKTVASSGGGGFLQQVARKGGLALPGATAMVKRIAEGLRDSIQALLGQAENGDLQALASAPAPVRAIDAEQRSSAQNALVVQAVRDVMGERDLAKEAENQQKALEAEADAKEKHSATSEPAFFREAERQARAKDEDSLRATERADYAREQFLSKSAAQEAKHLDAKLERAVYHGHRVHIPEGMKSDLEKTIAKAMVEAKKVAKAGEAVSDAVAGQREARVAERDAKHFLAEAVLGSGN
jgi:FKBP-type peptidyl-prolyl cis-trans isomerase